MFGEWDVGDVGRLGWGMIVMWDFQDVRCSGCGMFGMLDGIWDVDLQNASCSEIVSNSHHQYILLFSSSVSQQSGRSRYEIDFT